MASNFFGELFRITTFGESHGPAIGVVIDGCPAGIEISQEEIAASLALRRPGGPLTSQRKEADVPEILSGIFEGKTTGAPIAILIRNQDARADDYAHLRGLYRPGHANFTYLQKYGIFDHRGGGRASARETAARVAAGAVAKKLLLLHGIECKAFLEQVGDCKNPSESELKTLIEKMIEEKDSIGGIVACTANPPVGLGDPVYGKLEAKLASAMLSLPACKGFEIGSGFSSVTMRGSEHNDPFDLDEEGNVCTTTNFAGGTLGGISNGAPLSFRAAFKPASSIKKAQATVSVSREKATLQIPEKGRHDPCVAIRAVPVVEAMAALVLADALLLNKKFLVVF